MLPSSFAVGTAARSTIAAAALATCELGHLRGTPRQWVAVDMLHAAIECTGWFSINGRVPDPWDAFSGLYRCADDHVRVHANFAHHRIEGGLATPRPERTSLIETMQSGFGELVAVRHSAQLGRTPATWTRPSMPPGSHLSAWP